MNNLNTKDQLVKSSFYITYAFLITTGTITFIEAIRTNDAKVRHILNLETVISIIASFFYSQFVKKIQNNKLDLDYKDINRTRYLDWAITTPFMLIVLCLVFAYNNKTTVKASYIGLVLLINYLMLGSGYLGEINQLPRNVALIIGFVCFFLLFGLLYYTYLMGKNKFDDKLIYWAFVIFWVFYGVVYNLNEETKNIAYNILDLFSKCFIGIFFWAYLTKVITIF